MTTLLDLYNGVLHYNDKDIAIVIDDDNMIWFYATQICKILEYKSINKTLHDNVRSDNKTTYGQIKIFSMYKYNIQDHAVFINEYGLYDLVMRSRMKNAKGFQEWINDAVLPAIRKTGDYLSDAPMKKKLKEMNLELNDYKKKVKILEDNQKKSKYAEGGYVYVLQPPDLRNTNTHKIGQTSNLGKRMNTYNTSLPDNMRVVHKVKTDDPVAVEHCVKGMINHLRYRKNKEYYIIKKASIIKIVNSCAKSVKSARKIKRHIIEDIDDYPDDSDQDEQEIFAIVSVPISDDATQIGGMNTNINTNTNTNTNTNINNSDAKLLYYHNKMMYSELLSLQKLL